jgi:hypothetical protein
MGRGQPQLTHPAAAADGSHTDLWLRMASERVDRCGRQMGMWQMRRWASALYLGTGGVDGHPRPTHDLEGDRVHATHDLEGDRVHACTMVERLWCVCMHASMMLERWARRVRGSSPCLASLPPDALSLSGGDACQPVLISDGRQVDLLMKRCCCDPVATLCRVCIRAIVPATPPTRT